MSDYKDLRGEVMIDWDKHDPYGSCMSWWFAVADVLFFERDEPVPADWNYSPGAASEIDPDCFHSGIVGNYSTDALLRLGGVLSRVYSMCKHKGLDY